jgi:hypothetical protein
MPSQEHSLTKKLAAAAVGSLDKSRTVLSLEATAEALRDWLEVRLE